jgi:hypothetical protein
MVVLLPEPFGPRKAKISPRSTPKDPVDGGKAAEGLGQLARLDDERGLTKDGGLRTEDWS